MWKFLLIAFNLEESRTEEYTYINVPDWVAEVLGILTPPEWEVGR